MELANTHTVDAEVSEPTFGIELEFKSPTPPNRKLWQTNSARRNVAKQLAGLTGLPTANACTHSDHTVCPYCNHEAPAYPAPVEVLSRGGLSSMPSPRNYFLFKNEVLDKRKPPGRRHREWGGVEISTPVFGMDELDQGLPKMSMVLGALRTMEAEITADMSCGLHVHVGVLDGMSLLLAQKITTLVVVLEHALFKELVSPSRLGQRSARFIHQYSLIAHDAVAKQNDDCPENPLLTAHTSFVGKFDSAAWNNYKPDHFRKLLELIWSQESLQGFSAHLLTHQEFKRPGFAISLRDRNGEVTNWKHDGSLEDSKTTVEFRYMQMSFDRSLIHKWVRLLSRLVQIAQLGPDKFSHYFECILFTIENASYIQIPVWAAILTYVLDLEDQVPAWEEQIKRYRRHEDISFLDSDQILFPEANADAPSGHSQEEEVDCQGGGSKTSRGIRNGHGLQTEENE